MFNLPVQLQKYRGAPTITVRTTHPGKIRDYNHYVKRRESRHMNKEATVQTKNKPTHAALSSQHSMQRYLRYLRSDLQPVFDAELYTSQPQLDAWRQYQTN